MKIIKNVKIISLFLILFILFESIALTLTTFAAEQVNYDYEIDLENLSNYTTYETEEELEAAMTNGALPEGIYITKFLYDGVSSVKAYDLDDFTESGNDVEVKAVSITAININTTGNIKISGKLTGGMIAVNTNNKTGNINLYLDGVNLDTDSKKVPAIYVYNKDINYEGCKVSINTVANSENYIEGGKLKKTSLLASDKLDEYKNSYSGDALTSFETYTNYYGIYTEEELNNILFAKVKADKEDLADGDPAYFYKGSGAISSDIDLYFSGEGYLSVISKNSEGIETKGNITFENGSGDYYIFAEDDCLNTTTAKDTCAYSTYKSDITIDVNSLVAIVDSGEDSDEGDAIDSNGKLTIDGGTIVAVAHPGQDAGLDSENGTTINKGTVVATGDMFDAVDSSSQNYMALNFSKKLSSGDVIYITDESGKTIMAYEIDRDISYLLYSSEDLTDGTYYVYKGGTVNGEKLDNTGFYEIVTSANGGTAQGYSSSGAGMGGFRGGMKGERPEGEEGTTPPEMPEGEEGMTPPEMPEGEEGMTPPEKPEGEEERTFPQKQNGEKRKDFSEMTDEEKSNMKRPDMQDRESGENQTASNKEFKVSAESRAFSGVSDYSPSSESKANGGASSGEDYAKLALCIIPVVACVGVVIFLVRKKKKSKKIEQ